MVVVAATAFVVGAICLFYAARALRTRRAAARLDVEEDPTAWLLPPDEREEAPDDPVEDISIERGAVLLFLGLLCFLFGIISL
ncbi:hypothetical protein [Halopelagius longus]|uniref:Uncharacterized protein n=1 Tax=Halopelagius longus TaxID=1236180 RepID=A0A1H1ET33_9EURY|nr:hypothetical protein [Halopelagius longus]RDI71873.1 hypothetical protein DWB78_09135 [Halopelagius longus]SDQ91689.1 hypothetical protein SAMN05216278_3044 [Halopelagius longus]